MAVTQEYQKLVPDDLRKYDGLIHPCKAGFIERHLVKYVPLDRLHPKPEDEFSDPEIGPNYQIVANYVRVFARNKRDVTKEMFEDSLIVEKRRPDPTDICC